MSIPGTVRCGACAPQPPAPVTAAPPSPAPRGHGPLTPRVLTGPEEVGHPGHARGGRPLRQLVVASKRRLQSRWDNCHLLSACVERPCADRASPMAQPWPRGWR